MLPFLFFQKNLFVFFIFFFQINFLKTEDFSENNLLNDPSNIDNKNFEEIIFKKFDENEKKKIQRLINEIGQKVEDFLRKNSLESPEIIKYLLESEKNIKIEKGKNLSKEFKDLTRTILLKYEKFETFNEINFSELKEESIKFINSDKTDKSSIKIIINNIILGIEVCAEIEKNLKSELTNLFENPESAEKIYLSRNKEYIKFLKNKLNKEIILKSSEFFKKNTDFFKLSNKLIQLSLLANLERESFQLKKERCFGFKENDEFLKRSIFGFLTSTAIISTVNYYDNNNNFDIKKPSSYFLCQKNKFVSPLIHTGFIGSFNLDFNRIAKKEFKGPLILVLSKIYEEKKNISKNDFEFIKGTLSRSYEELIDDIKSGNFKNLKIKDSEYLNFSNKSSFDLEKFLKEINEKIKYPKVFEKKYLEIIFNKKENFIKYYSLNEEFQKEINNPILALFYLDRLNKNEKIDSKKGKKERSIDKFIKEFELVKNYFEEKKKEQKRWNTFHAEIDKIIEKYSQNGFYFSSNITNEIMQYLEKFSLGLTTNFSLIFSENEIKKLKNFESEKIEFNLKKINEAKDSSNLIRNIYEIFQENLQKKDFEKELFFIKINLILQKNNAEKLAKYLLGKEESDKLILEEKEIILRFIKLLKELKKSEMAEEILKLNLKLIETKIKQENLSEENKNKSSEEDIIKYMGISQTSFNLLSQIKIFIKELF